MSTWINNYNEPDPDYDPQLYRGGGYPWKYGGYDGYQGYSGQPGFKRDLGYVNAYQGVGSYYTGPKCKGCNTYYDDTQRCACQYNNYPDGDPYNPFDDRNTGINWNL